MHNTTIYIKHAYVGLNPPNTVHVIIPASVFILNDMITNSLFEGRKFEERGFLFGVLVVHFFPVTMVCQNVLYHQSGTPWLVYLAEVLGNQYFTIDRDE